MGFNLEGKPEFKILYFSGKAPAAGDKRYLAYAAGAVWKTGRNIQTVNLLNIAPKSLLAITNGTNLNPKFNTDNNKNRKS
jgi:hypothetical protein